LQKTGNNIIKVVLYISPFTHNLHDYGEIFSTHTLRGDPGALHTLLSGGKTRARAPSRVLPERGGLNGTIDYNETTS
jgi:hypothetical protein